MEVLLACIMFNNFTYCLILHHFVVLISLHDYLHVGLAQQVIYSRKHEELLIIYFEKARDRAPSVLQENNQQFPVYLMYQFI